MFLPITTTIDTFLGVRRACDECAKRVEKSVMLAFSIERLLRRLEHHVLCFAKQIRSKFGQVLCGLCPIGAIINELPIGAN